MNRTIIMLLTLAACSAAGGQLLFKLGARGREDFADFFNLPLMVGLLLYVISTVIWIYTLSQEKLVNVYSFTALTFALVYLGGVFLFAEKISLVNSCGILMVLAGLFLITR